MGWSGLANSMWHIRPWLAPLLAVIYLVPILRLITLPFQHGGRIFMKLNRKFGQWEEIISPLRDSVGIVWLAGGFVWQIWLCARTGGWQHALFAFAAAFLITLTFLNRRWKLRAHVKLLDFAERFPAIHPQEFFDHLFCSEGAVRHRFPESPFRTVDPSNLDFTRRGSKLRVSTTGLFLGIWSTIRIARLTLLLDRLFGQKILRKVAPSLATVWATRLLQLTGAKVTINGLEKIPETDHINIYLFTHKSFFDFVLAPLVPITLALRDGREDEKRLPLFLMAQNHFRRNILLYRFLGIGRAAEALGMMFVKRSDSGNRKRAARVAREAAVKILDEGMELAIFPREPGPSPGSA